MINIYLNVAFVAMYLFKKWNIFLNNGNLSVFSWKLSEE